VISVIVCLICIVNTLCNYATTFDFYSQFYIVVTDRATLLKYV